MDAKHSVEIRSILLDHDLTTNEKLDLLWLEINNILKKLKGSKRKKFILFVIATILFSTNGNVTFFTLFINRLRALIVINDISIAFKNILYTSTESLMYHCRRNL